MAIFSLTPSDVSANHGAIKRDPIASGYNSRIIDDLIFTDSNRMGETAIQDFLEAKLPRCQSGYVCLKDYVDPSVNKRASKIIYEQAKRVGLNPRVILVTLQKEQSLITDDYPYAIQYKTAMGYGCPESRPVCDAEYYGFNNQIKLGAQLLRVGHDRSCGNNSSFPGWSTDYPEELKLGRTTNPSIAGRVDGKATYIGTCATSSLYNYTPHRPDSAYQRAADGNHYYGNYNFIYFFEAWFGSTRASLVFKLESSPTQYLEWGDFYYPIPSPDTLDAYGLDTLAPRVVSGFPVGKTRGPILSRSAKFGSDDTASADFTPVVNIVDNKKYHEVPNYRTLSEHGYTSWINYDPFLRVLLTKGDDLRTVVRKSNGAIYAVTGYKLRIFPDGEAYSSLSGPDYTGETAVYSEQQLTNMSDAYIASKTEGAPMLLDGKFIKSASSPAIYLYDTSKKQLLSAGAYSSWGGRLDYVFSAAAVSQIPTGEPAPVLVKAADDSKYLVDSAKKKLLTAATQTAWGFSDNNFVQLSARALARLVEAEAKTLIQMHNHPAVYIVKDGKRHGIPSLSDFSGLDLNWADIDKVTGHSRSLLAEGSLAYSPGSLVRQPNGAVYLIDEYFRGHGVPSGAVFTRFGFNWDSVRNTSPEGLNDYAVGNLTTLLENPLDSKHYVVEGGVYRYLSAEARSPERYSLTSGFTQIGVKTLSTLRQGTDLTYFLRKAGDPTVYYIEDGSRRPFTNESSFYSYGGTWSQVTDVSAEFLLEIPRGIKIE